MSTALNSTFKWRPKGRHLFNIEEHLKHVVPLHRYAQAMVSCEQPQTGATARKILAVLNKPAPPGA